MQRTPVTSSQLKSVGFVDGEMHIEFNPRRGEPEGTQGPVYRYLGPQVKEHYDGLMAEHGKEGGSVGSFFIKNVKNAYKADGAESRYEKVVNV